MPIEIDVPPDPGRLVRLTKAVAGRMFLYYRIIGAFGLAAGVASLVVGDGGFVAVMLVVGGVMMIALPLLANRRLPSRQLVNGAWHYSIDQQGIVARSATLTTSYTWEAFVRARVTRSDVLLFLAKRFLIGIPRAGLPPAAEAELTRLLTARGLLAPADRSPTG